MCPSRSLGECFGDGVFTVYVYYFANKVVNYPSWKNTTGIMASYSAYYEYV